MVADLEEVWVILGLISWPLIGQSVSLDPTDSSLLFHLLLLASASYLSPGREKSVFDVQFVGTMSLTMTVEAHPMP